MAIEQRIDAQSGVIYRTLSGTTNTEELLDSFTRILKNPAFHPKMKSLTDLTGIKHFAFSADVKRIAGFIKEHREEILGGKAAIVVSSPVIYGMARMLQILTEDSGFDIAVFRDKDEACKWLGINTP